MGSLKWKFARCVYSFRVGLERRIPWVEKCSTLVFATHLLYDCRHILAFPFVSCLCPRTWMELGKEPWGAQVFLVRETEPCGTWAVGQSSTEAEGLFCRPHTAKVTSLPWLKHPMLGVMTTGRWPVLPESAEFPRLPYSQERCESSQEISGACEDTEICCSLQKTGWGLALFVSLLYFLC